MTNVIAPFGLQEIERYEMSSPSWGMNRVFISSTDATPIFSGDLVQNYPGPPASGNFGEYITQASSGLTTNTAWRGIFRGCEYLNTAVGRVVWSQYWPGSGAGADAIAYISDDMNVMQIAQATSAAIIGSSNVGFNIMITATASTGNTTSGFSGIAIQSSNISSLSSYPLRIRDFYSNFAPPGGFVNGTDNTVSGQVIVVGLNNFTNATTTGV